MTAAPPPRPPVPARPIAWILALGGVAAAGWFGVQAATARAQTQALRDQLALAEVALKSAESQLEAERVISARLAEQLAGAKR